MQNSLIAYPAMAPPTARSVVQAVIPLSPWQTCQAVFDRFSADADLFALPVTHNGQPVGMVGRQDFLLTFAMPYGRALYSNRPIVALMDSAPLIVDAEDVLEQVGARIVHDKPAALLRGFVVTEDGRYLGIGTGLSVLGHTLEGLERQRDELDRANRAAVAASQAKSAFLASMSHELRSPLNAVIGFADIIAEQSFGADAMERYVEYAGFIARSGRHLLDLINDILDISKIEAGRMDLELFDRNLVAELQDLARSCSAQAQNEGIRFEIEFPEAPVPAFADARAIRQIALNLASNAVKFSHRGGLVRFILSPPDSEGMSAIIVEDFGFGIREDMLERIWLPFERSDNSYASAKSGTGLGLALVRRLTELQRGEIVMESAQGQGTRVTLRLPANADVYRSRAGRRESGLTLSPLRGETRDARPATPPGLSMTGSLPSMEAILQSWADQIDPSGELPEPELVLARIDPGLERWMSLFEPHGDGDFLVVREGEGIVSMTREDWTGQTASRIDARHSGGMQDALAIVFAQRRPRLDLQKGLFQSKSIAVNRLLLPVRGAAGQPHRVMCLLLPQPDRRG